MKSALFHFFKVCFETEVCSEKEGFAVVLRHPFDQTKFRFYFAKHNTRFLYTKENPCSSEMAETRGDTMFPFIFLARTFPATPQPSAKRWGRRDSSTFSKTFSIQTRHHNSTWHTQWQRHPVTIDVGRFNRYTSICARNCDLGQKRRRRFAETPPPAKTATP